MRHFRSGLFALRSHTISTTCWSVCKVQMKEMKTKRKLTNHIHFAYFVCVIRSNFQDSVCCPLFFSSPMSSSLLRLEIIKLIIMQSDVCPWTVNRASSPTCTRFTFEAHHHYQRAPIWRWLSWIACHILNQRREFHILVYVKFLCIKATGRLSGTASVWVNWNEKLIDEILSELIQNAQTQKYVIHMCSNVHVSIQFGDCHFDCENNASSFHVQREFIAFWCAVVVLPIDHRQSTINRPLVWPGTIRTFEMNCCLRTNISQVVYLWN